MLVSSLVLSKIYLKLNNMVKLFQSFIVVGENQKDYFTLIKIKTLYFDM